MFSVERQEQIVQFVNANGKANTAQLAQTFGVSSVTIRRDIDTLAEKGLLVKTFGGAVSANNTLLAYEIPFSAKSEIHTKEKKAIGASAAALIEDGDIVILDSGSTTLEVAKAISAQNVTVLTNDIKIAMELAHKKNVTVIVSGGKLTGEVYSLAGSQAIDFFKKSHVNKLFLGCDAIDAAFGISNRTLEEVAVKTAMISSADQVIAVTDSSKLNKIMFQFVCNLNDIHKIVIDEINDNMAAILDSLGVEVILA